MLEHRLVNHRKSNDYGVYHIRLRHQQDYKYYDLIISVTYLEL